MRDHSASVIVYTVKYIKFMVQNTVKYISMYLSSSMSFASDLEY